MITVKVKVHNEIYQYLSVKGHAGAGEYGNDLICAGVSSIMFGLLNAIEMADKRIVINVKDNHIEVINDSDNTKINNYLELVILQLKTIEESYSQYIKIDERRN